MTLAIACLAAGPLAFADPPKTDGDGIVWELSFEHAKTRAAGEGKLLFVEFLTDGCPTCVAMEKETWQLEEVKSFLADKVCVKVNPGKGADQKKRMDDFGVQAVPTMILMSPEGKELVRASGKPAPGTFVSYFVNQRWNEMIATEQAGDWQATAGHVFVLKTWFPGTEATKRAESILAARGKTPEFKAALEGAAAANARAILLGKAHLLIQDRKKAEAIEAYRSLIAEHPDTPEAHAAKAALKKLGVKSDAAGKK